MKKYETLQAATDVSYVSLPTPTVENKVEKERITRHQAIAMGQIGLVGHRFVDPRDAGVGTPPQIKEQLKHLPSLQMRLDFYPSDADEVRRILNHHKSAKMHI